MVDISNPLPGIYRANPAIPGPPQSRIVKVPSRSSWRPPGTASCAADRRPCAAACGSRRCPSNPRPKRRGLRLCAGCAPVGRFELWGGWTCLRMGVPGDLVEIGDFESSNPPQGVFFSYLAIHDDHRRGFFQISPVSPGLGLSEPLHRLRASPGTENSSTPGPGRTPDLGAVGNPSQVSGRNGGLVFWAKKIGSMMIYGSYCRLNSG